MPRRFTTSQRLLTRAQRLVAAGNIDEALPLFKRAATLHKCCAGLYLHWALALAETGHRNEAVQAMHQAMALQPANAVLPMFLGQIFFDYAEYTEAQAWCERALDLDARQWRSIAFLALIAVARGDVFQGYQALQKPYTFSASPLDRLVLRFGLCRPPSLAQQLSAAWQSRLLLTVESYLLQHEATARSLAQQLLQGEPETQAPRPISRADRLFTRTVMQWRRVFCHLRYAAHATKKTDALMYLQAEEAYYMGQLSIAATLYQHLSTTPKMRDRLQQRLCDIAYEQGDFRQALTHLRRRVGQDRPLDELDVWDVMSNGELCYLMGDYQRAAAAFAYAATRPSPPQDYKLPYYLGLCKLRIGAPREARAYFAQAVQLLNPDIPTIRLREAYRVWCDQTGQRAVAM